MRRLVVASVVALTGLGLVVAGIGAAAARRHRVRRLDGVPSFGHVFLLIGENTSLSQDTARNTPYLVLNLKRRGAWLTNYFAVHGGSLADYIAMTSGHFTKCEVNDDLPYHLNTGKLFCHEPINNLFHQLDSAHVSWLEWNESMPNACAFFDTGTDWARNVYSTHHNPAVYYDDVEGAVYNEAFNRRPNSECLHRVIATGTSGPNDMSAFNTALAKGRVARFNMVIPNDCQQGHDPCGGNRVHQFDAFLAQEVPKIEASPAFGSNGLILITYDEWGDGTPHNHHVAFLALGPQVKPGVYSTDGPYTHYSLLRTLEDGFGISQHLLNAARAEPISQIWKP